jgi:hypothetical protein
MPASGRYRKGLVPSLYRQPSDMSAARAPVDPDRRHPGLPPWAAFVRALRQDLTDWLPAAVDDARDGLERASLQASGIADRMRLAALRTQLHGQRQAWVQALIDGIARAIDEEAGEGSAAPSPPATQPPALSLLDEAAIDEDIALSRLVQAAELEADGPLRELASRCSTLRGLSHVSADAHPMRPSVVARGLRQALTTLQLEPAQRLDALGHLAGAVANRLPPVYARQQALLASWGVQPRPFVALASPRPFGGPAADAEGANDEGPLRTALIQRPPGAGAPLALAAGALRRLVPAAGPGAAVGHGLPPAEVMARLLAVVLSRRGLGEGTRAWIRRLEAPARRMADTEPMLWQSAEHPLWQLLDRLMSAGSVLDDIDPAHGGSAGAALEAALSRLEQTDPPDARELQQALHAMDAAATEMLDTEAARLAPQATQMQATLAREELEARVREQIVQQVRGASMPAALHQFLVGPWTTVLAHSARQHGFDSPQFRVRADLIDMLVQACGRPRNRALTADAFTRCITHARLGLTDAGLPAARVEAELADLGRTLHKPWTDARQTLPVFDDATPSRADETPSPPTGAEADADRDEARPDTLGLHEALATVPIDMGPDPQAAARTQAACEAWLDALEPGTLCRLFVQGRWTNAQLVWRSLDRSMFVFSCRRAGPSHSMPRAQLHKLRAAGLAATIERGQFIAQALGELARATT